MKHNNFKLMFVVFLMLFGPLSWASRVVEIEEFYQSKVKEVLETRFPKTPFSVFVSIDNGRQEMSRRDNSQAKEKTKLPYWSDEGDANLDIWDRMDVPLETLIKQVRSVSVAVKVDASLSEAEMDELKDNLSKHLKLDSNVDRIEITRMNWSRQERMEDLKWILAVGLFGFLILCGSAWFFSRMTMNKLIKGLSKPISEIGQSTQQFANQALNLASDLSGSAKVKEREVSKLENEYDLPMDINLLEIRESALDLLKRNMDLFESPDAEFMDFIERKGAQDPVTMGSILAELNQDSLKYLFRFGAGNWWYKAIAQPAPLTAHSLSLLGEIDRLRVRRHFTKASRIEESEFREFALVAKRLSRDKLVELLHGIPLEKVGPVLQLLPRDFSLAVAKNLYPGQWAVFLAPQPPKEWKRDVTIIKDLEQRVLAERPLRDNEEITQFFGDLDLMHYLDVANPRDERDFYTVLNEGSRIKKERFPFFNVIDADEKPIKVICGLFSPQEWATALQSCDPSDRRQVLEKFPDRLRFQVIESIKNLSAAKVEDVPMMRARRSITEAYLQEWTRIQHETDSIINGEVLEKKDVKAA